MIISSFTKWRIDIIRARWITFILFCGKFIQETAYQFFQNRLSCIENITKNILVFFPGHSVYIVCMQWRETGGPWTNIQVEPFLPFPYPLSSFRSLPSLPISFFTPSLPSLPVHVLAFHSLPPFPTIPNPFLSFPLSLSLLTARGLGSAIAPPQRARAPPNAFLCNYSPKSANLLNFHPRAQDDHAT